MHPTQSTAYPWHAERPSVTLMLDRSAKPPIGPIATHAITVRVPIRPLGSSLPMRVVPVRSGPPIGPVYRLVGCILPLSTALGRFETQSVSMNCHYRPSSPCRYRHHYHRCRLLVQSQQSHRVLVAQKAADNPARPPQLPTNRHHRYFRHCEGPDRPLGHARPYEAARLPTDASPSRRLDSTMRPSSDSSSRPPTDLSRLSGQTMTTMMTHRHRPP